MALPLLFAQLGEEKKVANMTGSPQVKRRLSDMGFNIGSSVTVVQKIQSGLIVKVKDSRFAIDTGMASKILV